MKITRVVAFSIYDSRGLPTVACEITIDNQHVGLAKVPSGASTGSKEALELRDKNNHEWMGKGVNLAINNINKVIVPKIIGFPSDKQQELDKLLIELDGTNNKSQLGANAILAVSLAYCKACSEAKKLPLFKYLRHYVLNDNNNEYYFPIPLINVINGGQHSNNNLDFQEFLIVPINQPTWNKTMQVASECFLSLQKILKAQNISTAKGDEGGFSLDLPTIEAVLDLLIQSINAAGYKPGIDVCLALDVAASEFYSNSNYYVSINGIKQVLSTEQMINWYKKLCEHYPIISIEDPFDENDWKGFQQLNNDVGEKLQIIGDDLYCTNVDLLKKGIAQKATNAILIKLNQIGTLSECIDTILLAKKNNLKTIVSHRSGETEDDFIADFCLATNSQQIKTGSMSRSERLAKYNRLIYIDQTIVSLKKPDSIK